MARTAHDIGLMRAMVGRRVGVKASGAVRTREDAQDDAQGRVPDRIGASSSVAIVTGGAGYEGGYSTMAEGAVVDGLLLQTARAWLLVCRGPGPRYRIGELSAFDRPNCRRRR